MLEKKSSFPGFEKPEKIAKKELSPEELIRNLSAKGSLDLREASTEQQKAVLNYFMKNHEKMADFSKTDFLEQFMGFGLISDAKAKEFVEKLDKESASKIGFYIGKTLEPRKYAKTFLACFEEMQWQNHEEAIRLQEGFSKKGSKDLAMIAPFVEISKSIDLYNGKDINYEMAKELIRNMIDFLNEHKEAGRIKKDSYFNNIRENMKFLARFSFEQLLPHFSQLKELDVISENEWSEMINSSETRVRVSINNLGTEEEKEKQRKLAKKNFNNEENDYFDLERLNNADADIIKTIRDSCAKRAGEMNFANFSEYSHLIKNKGKYFADLIDRGIPVFLYVNSLGLDKKQIKKIINLLNSEQDSASSLFSLEDISTLLDFDSENKGNVSLEKELANQFSELIQTGHLMATQSFSHNIDKIFYKFSKESQKKLLSAMNQRPALYTNNIDFYKKEKPVSLEKLISNLEKDFSLLTDYKSLALFISKASENPQETAKCQEMLKKKTKDFILENPAYLNRKEVFTIQIFSKQEQKQIIEKNLALAADSDFIYQMILDYGSLDLELRNKLKEACEQKSAVLFLKGFPTYAREKLIEFLGEKSFYEIVLKNIEIISTYDSFDIDYLFDKNFIFFTLKNPGYLKKLLDVLKQKDYDVLLSVFYDKLVIFRIKNDFDLKHYISRTSDFRKRLKELRSSNITGGQKEELEKEKEKITKELKSAEEDKPKDYFKELSIENYKKVCDDVYAFLLDECKKKKFFIFGREVLKNIQMDALPIIKREIFEYAKINPQIIFFSSYFDTEARNYNLLPEVKEALSPLFFHRILGGDEYRKLLAQNGRAIAFSLEQDIYKLNSLKQYFPLEYVEILKINPKLIIETRSKLEKDFYLLLMDLIKGSPFYALGEKELAQIAKEEMDKFGDQLSVVDIIERKDFTEVFKTVVMLNCSKLAVENKNAILALPEKEKNEIMQILKFCSAHNLDQPLGFDLNEENYQEFKKILISRASIFIKKVFELDLEKDLSLDYFDFETLNALTTYYLQSCKGNSSMEKAFKNFILEAISGNYFNFRMFGEGKDLDSEGKEKGLEKIKEQKLVPQNLTMKQYEVWISEQKADFSEVLEYEIFDIQRGIKDVLSQAIANGHVQDGDIFEDKEKLSFRYLQLTEPLSDLSKRQKEINAKMEEIKKAKKEKRKFEEISMEEKEELEEIIEKIKEYQEENQVEINEVLAKQYLHALKEISARDLQDKFLTIDKKREPFKKVFKVLAQAFFDKPDFLLDILRMEKVLKEANENMFSGKRVSKSSLVLTDKIDLRAYTFIGERPVPSCQNYNDSKSTYNHGLLSYLTDPAVKIIQMYDENDRIISRAVLRLMSDKDGNPSLFMERVYTVNTHHKIKDAIAELGRKKAKEMGVPFYTQEAIEEKEALKGEKIFNHASRSPMVYTDAGGGKRPFGEFEIDI